jgi:hypothetical protein
MSSILSTRVNNGCKGSGKSSVRSKVEIESNSCGFIKTFVLYILSECFITCHSLASSPGNTSQLIFAIDSGLATASVTNSVSLKLMINEGRKTTFLPCSYDGCGGYFTQSVFKKSDLIPSGQQSFHDRCGINNIQEKETIIKPVSFSDYARLSITLQTLDANIFTFPTYMSILQFINNLFE